MVPGEVVHVVLPLAVWIVGWLPNNPHAAPASTLIVTVHIFHTNHYCGSHGHVAVGLNQDHCAIADIQLRAMVCDSNAQSKSERTA